MLLRPIHIICSLALLFWLAGCKRNTSSSSNETAPPEKAQGLSDEFLSLMNAGKNYLELGDYTNAVMTYKKAQVILPNDADVHLNLAISHLSAGAADEAVRQSDAVLKIEPNSAAAFFIKGSAYLRLSNFEEAVKAFENAKKIDPGQTATLFQLGAARMGLRQWDEAIAAFREGIALEPNRLHASAHYLLSQALVRAGRQGEAEQELLQHQAGLQAGSAAAGPGAAAFERSKYTQARVPFKLEQPALNGISLRFVESTKEALGENAGKFSGPAGVIDPNHTGWSSLIAREPGQGFRLLWNSNGVFQPQGEPIRASGEGQFSKILIGDLQNDRFEDAIALGEKGSVLLKFATNGTALDVSGLSRLSGFGAIDGLLMDLDFTGKLDLLALTPGQQPKVLRQFGPLLFSDITSTSGIPAGLVNARGLVMEDWNRDGQADLIVGRAQGPPLLLEKQRGGPLVAREQTNWPSGSIVCAGDFDNDLRPDLAVFGDGKIKIQGNQASGLTSAAAREVISSGPPPRQLLPVDYDNDGWLDLWAVGETIRVYRNRGLAGFQDQTIQLGLDKVAGGVAEAHLADFDQDCDSDLVLALAGGGLRYFRNDGGNANQQVKFRLVGNRSNASGIGCKVEIQTGQLRLMRMVHRLPVEVGVGKYDRLDSYLVHWFNWPQGAAEAPFNCKEPLLALELTIQEGSCPYLYAWDGKRFRFVTDVLGAAPLGLPVAEGRYIEADPEEYVWIGDEMNFPPKAGFYEVRISEELREALYLDEVKLVAVDRAPGVETHPTDKLLPGKPFPPGEILRLHREQPLAKAETLQGLDVTAALRSVDGVRVSPPMLRAPQLRGLAEPHGVILDFGSLDASRPLALVLNGWLRFGGGMANIAASHDPALPFPFPVLEAEVAPGDWKKIDVTVGAPAGKTKTILVDLEGKLGEGARRLRLTQAFEIHWDRIALLEKMPEPQTKVAFVKAAEAELHFRGFSALEELPPDWPLTPDYDRASPNPYWTIQPGGWCTRYGDVSELIASRDEGLLIMNSGDELSLRFDTASLPPKPPGMIREFFLYVDGWDKDSDFHVAAGTSVEPLPFHGMDDQQYSSQARPSFASDALHRKYNTRWVEGRVLRQTAGWRSLR